MGKLAIHVELAFLRLFVQRNNNKVPLTISNVLLELKLRLQIETGQENNTRDVHMQKGSGKVHFFGDVVLFYGLLSFVRSTIKQARPVFYDQISIQQKQHNKNCMRYHFRLKAN